MGFLDFWRQEQETQPSEHQLTLSGDSERLPDKRGRTDGGKIFKRFTDSIKANGGDCYNDAVQEETAELFGCGVRELYKATGGKRRDRSTLPEMVQQAYMANEVLTAVELERWIGSLPHQEQEAVNEAILNIVSDESKKTRNRLPW